MAAHARGGWFSTLLGGTALAVVGFGVGMLAGGLWESPDLVFHYLLGNTEEVARIEQEATVPPDESSLLVSAPTAAQAVERAAAGEPERQAEQPELPAVAARPPSSPETPAPAIQMAVQVGAFAESRAAEKLADGLRRKGYPVYLSPGAGSGDARWRVRVGPLASKEEAGRTAARLKTEEKLPTWVLSEDR